MSQKQRLFCSFFCDMNYDEQYRNEAKQQMKGKMDVSEGIPLFK